MALADVKAQVEQTQADFDAYKTKVAGYVADVTAAFARLQASIDANTLDPTALADLGDAVSALDADVTSSNADVDTADAVADAEDPATPPTGDTGTGDETAPTA